MTATAKPTLLGKSQLIDQAFNRIKESGDKKILKSQLADGIEAFLQEVELGLQKGNRIILKDYFSLSILYAKEAIKQKNREAGETIRQSVIEEVRGSIPDAWVAIRCISSSVKLLICSLVNPSERR